MAGRPVSAPTIRAVDTRRYASQVLTLTGAPAIARESGREFHPTTLTVEVLARVVEPGQLVIVRAVTLGTPRVANGSVTWSTRTEGNDQPLDELPLWVRPIVEPLFPELHYAAPRRVDAP